MSMNEQLDTVALLARLKLLVKRQFGESIDLDRLLRDKQYAQACLAALEERAETEEVLVMVLRVRQRLFPVAMPTPTPVAVTAGGDEQGAARNYKFGARSW